MEADHLAGPRRLADFLGEFPDPGSFAQQLFLLSLVPRNLHLRPGRHPDR